MSNRRTPAGQRKRDASIAKILAAAQSLFIEKGYEKTTMQDIVRTAESSVGNLYFNFASKEEILQTLVEDGLRAVYVTSDAISAATPPGPARLAVMLFTTAYPLLEPGAVVGHLVRTGPNAVTQRVQDMNEERVRGYLQESCPDLNDIEKVYASVAWSAAGVAISQKLAASDDVARDLQPCCEFFVRWNLRALGLPEPVIDDAIQVALAAIGDEAVIPSS